jgi:hypothetical protein
MADKPSLNRIPGPARASSPGFNGSPNLPPDVEIRLQSTERVKVVLQRCERTNAPHHLLVRIRETLISITTRDRSPRSH